MPSTFVLHDPHDHEGPAFDVGPRMALEITRGRVRRRWRPIEQRAFLIGTADDCDLVLGDDRFGSVHAYLLRHSGQATIRWLGDGPELTVNGETAGGSLVLADLDVIRTGSYEFTIHIGEEPLEDDDSDGSFQWNRLASARGGSIPRGLSALETVRCYVHPGQPARLRRTAS